MDSDTFIITVYCLVVEHDKMSKNSSPIRRGGFAPKLTDEEVIPREISGPYLLRISSIGRITHFPHTRWSIVALR